MCMQISQLILWFVLLIPSLNCSQKKRVFLSELTTSKGKTYYYNQNSESKDKESALYTGVAVDFYSKKQKKITTSFKRGKKHGLSSSWYPSGQLKYEGNFNYGKKIGIHIGYWPKGNIRFEKKIH